MLAATLERRREIQRMWVAISIAIYGYWYLSKSLIRTSIRLDYSTRGFASVDYHTLYSNVIKNI